METSITVLAATWLVFAPFLLGYVNEIARYNNIIVGILVGFLALTEIIETKKYSFIYTITFILGVWLIISPFMLEYISISSKVNDITLGIIISVVSLIRVSTVKTKQKEEIFYEE